VETENEWLKKMLFMDGMSGAPPFSGWYSDLFYRLEPVPGGEYEGHDYLVADVHTQPTDFGGAVVGRVLHVGVGHVNLGIFLANSPSSNFQPMAFVGPVMSYYEKITENFKRHTDEEWAELVQNDNLPERPDWVNVYLVDENGASQPEGRVLPGQEYLQTDVGHGIMPHEFMLAQNYPNPFNPVTTLAFYLPAKGHIKLTVHNTLGEQVGVLVDKFHAAGEFRVQWDGADYPSGIYFAKLQASGQAKVVKMMLVK
jgi:hypothetical protein